MIDVLLNVTSTANVSKNDVMDFIISLKISFYWSGFMIAICVIFAVLFLFGIVGNFWVMAIVVWALNTFKTRTLKKNVYLYLFVLSFVDSLVLFNLPMLVASLVMSRWIFGNILCKIYWIVESYNKLLSVFILTAMSFERFITICRPNYAKSFRKFKDTLAVLIFLIIFVSLLLIPVYFYAELNYYDDYVIINNLSFHLGKFTQKL